MNRPLLIALRAVAAIGSSSVAAMQPQITAPNPGARISLSSSTIVSGTAVGTVEGETACRWSIEPYGHERISLPQESGYDNDGFSISNCVRNVRFGAIPGIRAGRSALVLEVRALGEAGALLPKAERALVPVTFVTTEFVALGVSPGVALPGDGGIALYGEGFGRSTALNLHGPVYSLESPQVPICELAQKRCPSIHLAASPDATGTVLRFALPGSAEPGIYQIVASRSGKKVARWLMVESARKVRPVPPPELNPTASPIYSGQTVTGTFGPRRDPSGVFWDYNLYYFVAAAGSIVDISLDRIDKSKSWFHPDEIDPELTVFGPSNFASGDLWNEDVSPNLDLSSRIHDACLPDTGLYYIVAATTKGAGGYALKFSLKPGRPEGPGAQAVGVLGNDPFRINRRFPYRLAAIMLDQRGKILGDAAVNFEPREPDGLRIPYAWKTGVDFLSGAGSRTTLRGIAAARAQIVRRGTGTIEVSAELVDPPLTSPISEKATCFGSDRELPKAFLTASIGSIDLLSGEIRLRSFTYRKANR